MKREDDRLVVGEKRVELAIGSPCGCSLEGCSVIRSTTLTTRIFRSGKCSRSRSTAASVSSVGTSPAAGHHDIRLAASVVAGPIPDADAGGAVLDRVVHVEPLQRGLFAGHDHVHVIAAAQAMIGDREQAVRVGRQIHAHDVGFLVHDVIDEAGILMAEAVVVLPPDMRRQQIIQRRDRPPPGNVGCVPSATWHAG